MLLCGGHNDIFVGGVDSGLRVEREVEICESKKAIHEVAVGRGGLIRSEEESVGPVHADWGVYNSHPVGDKQRVSLRGANSKVITPGVWLLNPWGIVKVFRVSIFVKV